MKICDLHTHTNFSDGTFSPSELIDEAVRKGLSAIALTDHNNVGGIAEFLSAAKGKDVKAVAGIEFSTDYGETELHMLGLFLKPSVISRVDEYASEVRKRKEDSNRLMVEKLRKAGYDVDYDKIEARCGGTMNRAHIGEELFRKGYTKSIQEAFSTVLAKKSPFYCPVKRLDVFETIEFVRSVGAVPVLAHPFLDLDVGELREFLKKAVPCGLIGMETVYTTFTCEQTGIAKSIALEFGLKQSGGSDFHGYRKPDISLATGRGNLVIPYSFYENLNPESNG